MKLRAPVLLLLASLPALAAGQDAAGQDAAAQGVAGQSANGSASAAGNIREPMPWMLMLAALVDQESYENALASFHLGVADATWLSLAAGTSRAPSTEAKVEADILSAGIEHDFGPLGIALAAERWGDDDELESADWRGEIFVAEERFRAALLLESREIEIHFADGGGLLSPARRRATIDADGVGIGARLRIVPLWRLYGSWMEYDYPAALRLVPRADNLNLLSVSAVTLAYSLVDRYARLGIERSVGRKLVNFDLGSDTSAIDGERLESASVSVLWPVGSRFDLELQLGSSRTDGYGSSLYGGISVLFYGGG